jgi:hypothetical protein
MKLRCQMARHTVARRVVRNQGFSFSHCGRCGRDLVRAGGQWRTVPKGFRVVWRRKSSGPVEQSARQMLLNLPVIGRSLAPRAAARKRRPFDIILFAAMGLRYLLWGAGERLSSWRRRGSGVRAARRQVIHLPSYGPARSGAPS